jgi:crotonobetainyl-CoA:carnitine CoA-transferase CaiB-like acyl-CoA transferase
MDILMRLVETADVFLTNTRAKSLVKLGLDGETLTKKFPRLIYASLDGYGRKGPDADTPGFDGQAFWTRSGYLLDMSEEDAGYPDFSPASVGDCVTGGFLMAGIMTALYNREKTGHGDIVHTSLYGSAIWVMNTMIIKAQEKYGKNETFSRKTINPLTANFMCQDGEWFRLGVINYSRDAVKVYDLLGISDRILAMGVVDYATKTLHNAEVLELFQQTFMTKPAAEWDKIFKAKDIPCVVMQHFKDVSKDEQAWANHYVEEYRFPNGETCVMPRTPIHIASAPAVAMTPASLPGAETDEILRSYGYSEEEILNLRQLNTVK